MSLLIFPHKFFALHIELEQLVRRDLKPWFSEDERIELLMELGHKNVQNPVMMSKSGSGCIIYDQKRNVTVILLWNKQKDAPVIQTGKEQTKKWLSVLSVAPQRKALSYNVL